MKRVLYLFGGPEFHPTEWAGKETAKILAADNGFQLDATSDLDALASLPGGKYAAVVVYTTGFKDDLTAPREKGLLTFVKNGGGFVGIHSAADSFRGSRPYLEMLNGEFLTHPEHHEFTLYMVKKDHYLTVRMPDFALFDEMYHLQNYDASKATLLAQTPWQGKEMPMAYVRAYGRGRVVYLANGHTKQAWEHPDFRKLVLRAITWSTGAQRSEKTIRCGLLGYGAAFNMGRSHGQWIDATPGLKTVAMCDNNPARKKAAKQELPDLEGRFSSLGEMLKRKDLDLVVNILPHNLHAPTAMQSLNADKHIVMEKPFCITVKEADDMINLARKKGLMLSVFHNRRWDGDYLTIRKIIDRGLLGDIFHIECGGESYGHPGFWWRSDKAISGGIMHDWGSHLIDWILNLVPAKITQVMGDFQKRVWNSVTNEDHGQVYVRFENGVTADCSVSTIAANSRPKWRILGTKGALEASWNNEIKLVSLASGVRQESAVKVTLPGYGCTEYYRNIADHLLMKEELAVTPEQARRVIGIIQAARHSSQSGASVPPVEGCA